jgi:dTDP-4-dehydrorhamnose reductase
MKHLLVTGASGLLGLNLALLAADEGYQVTGVVHHHPLHGAPFEALQADLGQPGAAARLYRQVRPDAIIHCAAVASLDAAEAEPAQAQNLNAVVPGSMAAEAAYRGLPFVQISTDAVFDGGRGDYTEEDTPKPLGIYARTKLAGELAVLVANPQALVARVVFYGWSLSGKRSLAEFFVNHLTAGQQVKGFTDIIFCPLLVNDLAAVLMEMLAKELHGLYHVVSRECLSKYAFGVSVARQFGLDEGLITPVSVGDGNLAAPRSPNLSLSCGKLEQALGHVMPGQAEGLQRFYALYQQGYPARIKSFLS